MKIFHISDLHIGKQLHSYSLREDQKYILDQIIRHAKEQKPDVLVIAGDIYDKAVPSAEAGDILNRFFNDISELSQNMPVLVIAGNHDSAVRLQYAGAFLEKSNIIVSTMPPSIEDEFLRKVILKDAYGEVSFYLMPFTRPRDVRHLFPEGVVVSYDTAIKALIERENIDFNGRNVLISHQFFVSGSQQPEVCESEQNYLSVGGIDSVDIQWVKDFDYVALGHIHGAQKMGYDHIRYSGTPLKYSVSEVAHEKSITVITLGEKGAPLQIDRISLVPLHDVCQLKGTLQEMMELEGVDADDYVSITLTDEDQLYRPKDQLEEKFHNILEVRLDNQRIRARFTEGESSDVTLNPLEAFAEFYQEMNGQPMSEEEEAVIREILEEKQL